MESPRLLVGQPRQRLIRCRTAVFFTVLACLSPIHAQLNLQTGTDPVEAASPGVPQFEDLTDLTVHEDAMLLLAQEITATGTAWATLEIAGNAVLGSGDSSIPATFQVNGMTGATLTFQQSSGLTAIQTLGSFRKSVYADGTFIVDSSTTGPAGLLPSQILHSASIAQRLLALKLTGTATVRGSLCDKLSLRYVLTGGTVKPGSTPKNVQVDFYLDHTTHLISRSVSSVLVPGLSQPELLVTDYTGYKSFAGTLAPQRITQTIGGFPLWDVSVGSVTAVAAATSTGLSK